MVYSETYEHTVENMTTYRAYDTIQDWLRLQGGRVKENRRASLIVATHGSSAQKNAWERNSKKTLRFELKQEDLNVNVKIHVSSSTALKDPPGRTDDARRNWNQLFSSLWGRMGEGESTSSATKVGERRGFESSEDLMASMRRGRRLISLGTALAVAGLVFSFVPTGLEGIAVVASSIGIILMVNGWMTVRSTTKRLSAQTGSKQK